MSLIHAMAIVGSLLSAMTMSAASLKYSTYGISEQAYGRLRRRSGRKTWTAGQPFKNASSTVSLWSSMRYAVDSSIHKALL